MLAQRQELETPMPRAGGGCSHGARVSVVSAWAPSMREPPVERGDRAGKGLLFLLKAVIHSFSPICYNPVMIIIFPKLLKIYRYIINIA